MDGLLELGWVRGSEVGAAKTEFHAFVYEQRQVKESASRSRVSIISLPDFRKKPGFHSRRSLHKVSTGWGFESDKSTMILHIRCVQVFQSTTLVVRGPLESHPTFTVSRNGVTIDHEEVKIAVACVQDFVGYLLFT